MPYLEDVENFKAKLNSLAKRQDAINELINEEVDYEEDQDD